MSTDGHLLAFPCSLSGVEVQNDQSVATQDISGGMLAWIYLMASVCRQKVCGVYFLYICMWCDVHQDLCPQKNMASLVPPTHTS